MDTNLEEMNMLDNKGRDGDEERDLGDSKEEGGYIAADGMVQPTLGS
jgi:hypothetical protein